MQHDKSEETIVEMPIDGTIDLHTFHPKDIKDLIPVYLDECLARGMEEIRIIHGKGRGVLRRIVHSMLDRHPSVVSYKYGRSWGDTIVILRRNTD